MKKQKYEYSACYHLSEIVKDDISGMQRDVQSTFPLQVFYLPDYLVWNTQCFMEQMVLNKTQT